MVSRIVLCYITSILLLILMMELFALLVDREELKNDLIELKEARDQLVIEIAKALKIDKLLDWVASKLDKED